MTARFTVDSMEYILWYEKLTMDQAKEIRIEIEKVLSARHGFSTGALYELFHFNGWQTEENWVSHKLTQADSLQLFFEMTENYGISLRIGEWVDGVYAYLYLQNPEKGVIIYHPELYLEKIPDTDYSKMSPSAVRRSMLLPQNAAQMDIIPSDANSLTIHEVSDQKRVYEDALQKAKKNMSAIKNCQTEELAALQEEIRKKQEELEQKKESMMAELREKMEQMEEMKESLENQIYLLDSQIYAIRCFAGDVVKFTRIRFGKQANITSPVVIYQKLHFLDEDLGRLASLYDIQWKEMHLFENFLKHSPLALETFVPNERCISLIRISRDGKTIDRDDRFPCANMMRAYQYYHGTTIGILIRNGENLYLGWTEEERVHIQDDLLMGKIVTETEPAKEMSESEWRMHLQEQKAERKKLIDGLISRSFVYNILQGVVEHTSILPLPSGVTLGKPSEFVVYSMADAWLTDNRYGNFNDIIDSANEHIAKGHCILTVQHLRPEQSSFYAKRWENPRGRGDANRTHDVSASDCHIYPVNLIEYDAPVKMVRYKWTDSLGEEHISRTYADRTLSDDAQILEEYDRVDKHVFISLKKRDSECDARSNFEVYDGEYINLTYLNSVVLEYVITTKSLGDWRVGRTQVNYAYAIRYLKKALDFVKSREAEEKALLDMIDPSICRDPDWPITITSWKKENEIHRLSEYQAKRFVKYSKTK